MKDENKEKPKMNSTTSVEERKSIFIEKSKLIHGNRYDYSKVVYTVAQEKVEIICPVHGSFFQQPYTHGTQGRGCRKCGYSETRTGPPVYKRDSQEEYLAKARKVHGDKYDYSKVEYKTRDDFITIICPTHGEFSQKAGNHTNGRAGCRECGIKSSHDHYRRTTQSFVKEAREIHNNKYTYEKTNYISNKNPIIVTCSKHGDFTIGMAHWHIIGSKLGCPNCTIKGRSDQERRLAEYIESLGFEPQYGNRTILNSKELDIVIESKKLAIEYNGNFWHTEKNGKDEHYHLNKTKQCSEKGYQLIHIFEDEWLQKEDIVKAMLAHKLGVSGVKKHARKLEVKKISSHEGNEFFEKTHIQGKCSASDFYGLYEGEDLLSAISLGNKRFSKTPKVELIRFSSICFVVGGFTKLLTAYIRDNPRVKEIFSFSDKRWSVGKVYETNGFIKISTSKPNYFYIKPGKLERLSRYKFQKAKLKNLLKIYDENKTEVTNMLENGYTRIFDCGSDLWVLKVK